MWLAAGCGGSGSEPLDMSTPADARGGGSDGLKAFGESCASDGECQSDACFHGSTRSFCSLHCTAATAAHDCPVPPTLGICNMMGYCRAP
jgi:hypothetical protein